MEMIVDENQPKLNINIVAEFEVINHNYKILIVTLTTDRYTKYLYTKYLFKATKYEDNICISAFDIYTANTDLSKEINDICIDYSNIECNVTIVHRDNAIYSIEIRPIYNTNVRCLVFYNSMFYNSTGITDMSYNTKFIYNYLSNHLYLFDINNEYVLK